MGYRSSVSKIEEKCTPTSLTAGSQLLWADNDELLGMTESRRKLWVYMRKLTHLQKEGKYHDAQMSMMNPSNISRRPRMTAERAEALAYGGREHRDAIEASENLSGKCE